jgi:hypothetical protein
MDGVIGRGKRMRIGTNVGCVVMLGDTFTTYSAAQTRSCNNQHNACADIANSKTVCSSIPISLNIER